LSEFELPVVLKPPASFNVENLINKNYVRKAYATDELNAYLESLLYKGKVLVQENFIGTCVGVEVLAKRGELLVAFQHVRIHEPLMGGGSSYRKSVPIQPELLDAVRKLVKILNYTGVAMVEFKVNFETGDWVLIEINGRFWGSLPLAVSAGVNFPYYLYQLLVEGKREFPQRYKKEIYCRNLLNDLGWMLQNFKADRSDPTLATLPLRQVAKEVINILTFRERSDTFVMDDLKPGFVELVQLIHTLKRMTLSKILLFLLTFPPIRKLYADKIRRVLGKAKKVLFVCKGNICRSPFAQYYARTIFPESVDIMSCGYYPVEGRVCPKEVVDVAKELGIDLTPHCSCVINEEMVSQAQVILTFDEQNFRTLIIRYPFAKQKIHLIGFLAPQGPITIKDPYGGTISDFKAVDQIIIRTLDSYMNP
jgi:protein-tyrosine-phosphatase